MKNERFLPDFLGIGAQKAGTTWLWQRLSEHPGIWMPPVKELHYFDRSPRYPSPGVLDTPLLSTRLLSRKPKCVDYRRLLRRRARAALVERDWDRIRWDTRFLLGRYDDDWYASLFRMGKGRLLGEITPGYSMLRPRDVDHVERLLPEARVIFLIRNPVDRAWSQIRSSHKQDASVEQLKAYVDWRGQELRGNYLRTIRIWRLRFARKRFGIWFYDDISTDPQGLLDQVCDFLGVLRHRYDAREIREPVNAAVPRQMPPELERYVARKYHDMVAGLADMLGGHAVEWLTEIELCLR